MKSRKFESFNDAIEYLSTQGKLSYQGRIGLYAEICLYTYKHQGIEYRLYIYLDGLVEIRED